MAAGTPQGINLLLGWQKATRFSQGIGAQLPAAYVKFWKEWKETRATPVHYIAENPDDKFRVHPITGKVVLNQIIPIPLKGVVAEHKGFWGGEAIIKGFQKRTPYKRRVPHFWIPDIKQSVVRSEVLNENFSMNVTDRTIRNIMENNGFDHYVLKTKACDLRSLLVMKIKKKMLRDILDGFPAWVDVPSRQKELSSEYSNYAKGFSDEDIEWYGLSWQEALFKLREIQEAEAEKVTPHKEIFRSKLIEQLRQKASEIAAETK